MSVATEDSRTVVPLSEMFGKLVEMRLECMAINEAIDGVVKLREAAEAAYAKDFKECEDAEDSPLCPEKEAEIKKDFTDRYIYEKGFYDGIFTVQHSLNVCVSGLEDTKPSEGLRLPRYVAIPSSLMRGGKGDAGQGGPAA